jgi:hypothetical protein
VKPQEDQYHLSNFTFENLSITGRNIDLNPEYVENFTLKNIKTDKK